MPWTGSAISTDLAAALPTYGHATSAAPAAPVRRKFRLLNGGSVIFLPPTRSSLRCALLLDPLAQRALEPRYGGVHGDRQSRKHADRDPHQGDIVGLPGIQDLPAEPVV